MLKKVLMKDGILYEEKKEAVIRFFAQHNLRKPKGQIIFIFCRRTLMVSLFYDQGFVGFYILLSRLKEM